MPFVNGMISEWRNRKKRPSEESWMKSTASISDDLQLIQEGALLAIVERWFHGKTQIALTMSTGPSSHSGMTRETLTLAADVATDSWVETCENMRSSLKIAMEKESYKNLKKKSKES